MFFTRLARLIALLGLILGGLRLATAFFVASIDDVEARTICDWTLSR